MHIPKAGAEGISMGMHQEGRLSPVVLLHGLGRTSRSMRPVARALEARGYRVFNLGYASRSAGVALLAKHVAQQIRAIPGEEPLHFITHSMGGILLRVAVANGELELERIGRVVMLGPPNGGSQVADAFTRWRVLEALYKRAVGPAGLELGVDHRSVVTQLPPLPFEAGIIAGSRSVNPILSMYLPGPNDGKVSVARASAGGMRGFIVVPHAHPFIMRAPRVIAQAIRFLETGSFG
jgi:pimeloyl-ACP methyl ester carboxylesterase